MRHLIPVAILTTVILAGCSNPSANRANIDSAVGCSPAFYYEGVYYFPCTGPEFGKGLANFKKTLAQKGEEEVVAMTGDGKGPSGSNDGHFVSTRQIHK